MEPEYGRRINRLTSALESQGLNAVLVFNSVNQRYLSGSDAGATLIITKDGQVIQLVNRLESERARITLRVGEVLTFSPVEVDRMPGEKLVIGKLHNAIVAALEREEVKGRIGIEAKALSHGSYISLSESLKGYELVDVSGLLSEMRAVKDQYEIEAITEAAKIAEDALRIGLDACCAGALECEVAAEIEYFMRKKGYTAAFETIVASGTRSALPHGFATRKRIENGDLVVIDLGAKHDGYCSDMTRTVTIGQASARQKALLEAVAEAQEAAIDAVEPGKQASEIDKVARDVLRRCGLACYFNHSLGHGVGLAVHEAPGISQTSKTQLKPGMVFTVEPGVYLPGYGGVRIEDMVLVTEKGARLLTSFARLL